MRFEEEFLKHTVNGVKAAESAFRDQKVATRIVPWSSHLKSDFITREEYSLIDKYDKKSDSEKKAIFATDGDRLAQFFVDFLQKSADLDTIQYVLYLVNEIIRIEPKALNSFVKLNSSKDANYPFNIFFRLFNREDNNAYVNLIAGIVLGNILAAGNPAQKEVDHFINWSLPLLRKTEPREVEVALIALQPFLARDENRVSFNRLEGTNLLVEILANNASSNTPVLPLLYEALYCTWLLSFSPSIKQEASDKKIVPTLVQIAKTITKEKIIRLSIASLRNLMGAGQNNEDMIEGGLVRMLNFLSNKKWGDQDIVEDLEKLSESLSQDIANMSSFDKYRTEVQTNELEWSPVHKSENFWKENAMRFEEHSHSVLKLLHLILQKSENAVHLSIACHDLGEFSRFHPRGKIIIEALGIKQDIMRLMSNPNEEVKKQALFALQKMMINNWEYLSAK